MASLEVGFVEVAGKRYVSTVGTLCSTGQYIPDPAASLVPQVDIQDTPVVSPVCRRPGSSIPVCVSRG